MDEHNFNVKCTGDICIISAILQQKKEKKRKETDLSPNTKGREGGIIPLLAHQMLPQLGTQYCAGQLIW